MAISSSFDRYALRLMAAPGRDQSIHAFDGRKDVDGRTECGHDGRGYS
jgi:hypothetical protein